VVDPLQTHGIDKAKNRKPSPSPPPNLPPTKATFHVDIFQVINKLMNFIEFSTIESGFENIIQFLFVFALPLLSESL
jgi:hypothetical protein